MVEIIPKKPARELPFKNILPFVAGAVLATVVLGYAIIARSNARALVALGELEDSTTKVGTREDKLIETKVFDSEKKMKSFNVLLVGRRKSSNFFDNFSGLIHPQVWLSEINLDVSALQASVSGKSPNFKILEQQLAFFKTQNDLIDSLDLTKIVIGKNGEAEFSIQLNFKKEVFN